MKTSPMALVGTYDLNLVGLSIAIAVLASYAALDLANRVTGSQSRMRLWWLTGGAAAMGSGIWSMHYIGMVALRLPIPVRYDILTVLLSLLAAMFASAVALFSVSRLLMSFPLMLLGGTMMGLGITAMHYTGMAAMRLPATMHYDPLLVTASAAIAIGVSFVGLLLLFRFRVITTGWNWWKAASAIVMGLAIPTMHYTGMAAVSFVPTDIIVESPYAVDVSVIAILAIACGTVMLLGITLTIPRRRGFYVWLPLLVVTTMVLMLAVGASALHHVEAQLVSASGENLRLTASETADKLSRVLYERRGDVMSMAQNLGLHAYDRAHLTQQLLGTKTIYAPSYQWLAVTDLHGRIVAATDQATVGLDVSRHAWFQSVREGGTVYVGDVQPDELAKGMDAISFTAPIISQEGQFLGAVTARVTVTVFDDLMTQAIHTIREQPGFLGNVQYQFMTSNGDVFVDSDLLHKGLTNLKRLGQPSALLSEKVMSGSLEEENFRRHVQVITGFARAPSHQDFPGLQWTVLVRIDLNDILHPIREILWKVGAAGFAVVIPMVGLLLWVTNRVQKEHALAQHERDISQEYLDIARVMILVLNADQTVRLINKKGCEILGYPEEEVVGKRWGDHFLPERDRARLNGLFEELKAGKPLEHVENPVLTKDGRERMISWYNTVLRDAGGAITGTLSSGEDITERNQAELRLAAQYAVTQVLAKSSTLQEAGAKILRLLCECFDWEVGAIWKVDRHANLLRCIEIWHDQNANADEFVAASRQRTFAPGVGMPGRVWERGEPAWIPDVLKDLNFPRAPMAAKAGLHGAVGFPIKIGKNVYGIIEFFSREIREPDRDLLQMVGDIGIKIGQFIERNRAEMALQESNTRFKQLAENVDEIFYITDADITKILYANPAYETIWGRTCQSLYDNSLSFIDAIHPDDRERAFAFLDQQKKGLDTENEYRIVRPDGSIRWVRDRGYPVRNERGQLHRIVGIVQDITQRKQMEAHAGELERLTTQGQLMDGIAHEMKNPLFILTGRLQLMKEKLAHQEYGALSDDLQKIESAATRMVSIADRFSKLVKAPSSSTEPTAVQAVLQQVLELLAGELTKNRIAVTTALAPDLPVIQANPRQLQMAFTNLIVNAMQAMASAHGKGTLTVTAAIQNGWIEVRIQDDGPGIAPEHRARLFEPFFTTKPAGRGTGMSLWAVRSTVMALRGTVACETDTGKGATFIMRLPAATPDGQP